MYVYCKDAFRMLLITYSGITSVRKDPQKMILISDVEYIYTFLDQSIFTSRTNVLFFFRLVLESSGTNL